MGNYPPIIFFASRVRLRRSTHSVYIAPARGERASQSSARPWTVPTNAPVSASADLGNPMELFLTGKLGMVWDGSWSVGTILQGNRRQFEFTSFWLPPVTKATSEYVSDPPHLPSGVGGYGSMTYTLNPNTIKKGCVDECVDWLMYITTPKNDEMIVNEVPGLIPANKKARSLPEIESMFVGETRLVAGAGHRWSPPAWWFGSTAGKYKDTMTREMDLYLLNEQDLDTMMAHMETAAKEECPAILREAAIQYAKDGSWDLTQWTCQPTV